ncbi:glycosyltransferase family 2 protein [Halococcus hamelinensis]|uniref:glycosyltransferase family 2 protein n=1 Tax=Halococcus hamelinensis TaxID=332168 RepID=UPI0009A1C3D8
MWGEQTYSDVEVIVVENRSDRPVSRMLEEDQIPDRVRYIRHDKNKGGCATRNTGMELVGRASCFSR